MSAVTHEMPADGAWSETGEAWFPRSQLTRSEARSAYQAMTGVPWVEIHALARHARHAPDEGQAREYDGEYWLECSPDTPGAFPVWRCG